MKNFFTLFLLITILSFAKNKQEVIILSTTSTENSGLFSYILPEFEKDTGIKTKVIAVGTGKALQMGKDGEGDILIVHDKSKELEFVKEGHGTVRKDLMYNEFVLIGPKGNFKALKEALEFIDSNNLKFISRGDNSGTHAKELELWKKYNISINKNWYISAGSGMGSTIQMADEKLAYTLTDKATFLSMKDKIDLKVVFEKEDILYNQYGVILVNPNKNKMINSNEAKVLMDWLLSKKGQNLIGSFGVKEFKESLFVPNGK